EHRPASGRGWPRVLFSQRRDCGYLIVVIISSDAIQYSLVDYAGTLLDRFVEERREDTAEAFAGRIRGALERVAARSNIARDQVLLISFSSKGLVSQDEPRLVWSPMLATQELDFRSVLSDGWVARVVLNNETLLVA